MGEGERISSSFNVLQRDKERAPSHRRAPLYSTYQYVGLVEIAESAYQLFELAVISWVQIYPSRALYLFIYFTLFMWNGCCRRFRPCGHLGGVNVCYVLYRCTICTL